MPLWSNNVVILPFEIWQCKINNLCQTAKVKIQLVMSGKKMDTKRFGSQKDERKLLLNSDLTVFMGFRMRKRLTKGRIRNEVFSSNKMKQKLKESLLQVEAFVGLVAPLVMIP